MKKGILLVNMGGAESPKQLRGFLFKMFMDKHIIGAPLIIRFFLAFSISRRRYKKSWKKYEQIGGTPILKAGKAMAEELAKASKLPVEISYSYSRPFIDEGIEELKNKGVESISVIPLYPQASFTTTSSVLCDTKKLEQKYSDIKIHFIKEFYHTEAFITYWISLINAHITEHKINKPSLVFAAHSIPQSIVDKGDTYTHSIEENARVIAEKLGYEYDVSYQSKFGPVSWYGNDTKDVILDLVSNGAKDVIVVPISFISECLETIYDIDIELFPELADEIPSDVKLSRITMPYAHPLLIDTFKSLI